MYTQAVGASGYETGTLRDAKWVAARYELSVQTDNLSFAHHRIVAALPIDERTAILAAASREGWTCADLRRERRHASAKAIERYVSLKAHKDEARRAARVCETAVGEALGPTTQTYTGKSASHASEALISKDDCYRFRRMAAHRDLWWPRLAERGLSRNEVLTMIAEVSEAKAAQKLAGRTARVVLADCMDMIDRIQPIDLLIADPPYFTDGDFTPHISACLKRVKITGQAYVFASAEPREVAAFIAADTGNMILTQMLVWNYNNTGQRQPNERYTSNYQVIFYYRGQAAPKINKPTDGKEQYACQTINAPDGRKGDRWHKWQKPTDLLNRLVRNSSAEGDFVFDPFCGSGTTILSAAALGRDALGCDTSQAAIDICFERGCVDGDSR